MDEITLAARVREVCDDPAVRRALARRDVTTVYRRLVAAGLNQRQVGQLTGQRPSEVSEIIGGRAVQSVVVLERIADGLGVGRGEMGLAYTDPYTDGEDTSQPAPDAQEEMEEDVKRRNFINAIAGAAVWGHPILTDLLTAPRHTPTPLPTRLGAADVEAVRALTSRMRGLARFYGGQAETISEIARRYTRLLSVPATDEVTASMQAALVDLHLCAGWASVDAQLTDRSRQHFGTAMDLAADGEYPVGLVYALWLSGAAMRENGYPNDALKMYQLGEMKLADPGSGVTADPRVPLLTSRLHAVSAYALVQLDRPDLARRELAVARGEWEPSNDNHRADADHVAALVERDLRRIDVAEQFASSSVRHWERSERPDRRLYAVSRITLAELHLTAREPDGAYLAKRAIDATAELSSARARARLAPLETALLTRRDSACADLARQARAVRLAA